MTDSQKQKRKQNRHSGIFCHPSSFPGADGIGTLGSSARAFIDWLSASGQRLWQIMPLGPTGYGNSPYATLSAFAGNPLLIDLTMALDYGWLSAEDVQPYKQALEQCQPERISFDVVSEHKPALLLKAWTRFKSTTEAEHRDAYHGYCLRNHSWLHDYARFAALKDHHDGKAWTEWQAELVTREPTALAQIDQQLGDAIGAHKFIQWLFSVQWTALKNYAHAKDIVILGDVPIFVAHDSSDVWAQQELFYLNEDGSPAVVAGVPPDYFSETGQLWGNPLYRWDVMQANQYQWWTARIQSTLETVDMIRIDHFRGFEAYWEIPGGSENAIGGRWVKGPGHSLFRHFEKVFGKLPFVAEDLGVITDEVEELRDQYDLPGMRVLQFAFSSDATDKFLPHNHSQHGLVYLGTHDNDTTVGWLESLFSEERSDAQAEDLERLLFYLGRNAQTPIKQLNTDLIRQAIACVSSLCILTLQDIFELDTSARMNTPSVSEGNWEWRALSEQFTDQRAAVLKKLCSIYGRCQDD